MGAEFQFTKLDTTDKSVQDSFHDVIEQAGYDYGHSGYSGSFAEKHELIIKSQLEFSSLDAAEMYLCNEDKDSNDKWGAAVAIRYEREWYVGAWCSS